MEGVKGMLGDVRHEVIAAERSGQRLDNFLMGLPEKPPRSLVYRLIRTGQVRVNGKRSKPMQKLQLGDDVRIPPLEAPTKGPLVDERARERWARQIDAWTLESGDGWVALDKPSGLAMHGGTGVGVGLIDMVQASHPTWQLVHRLDRATSGIVLVATDRAHLLRLQALFRDRQLDKRYLALLQGRLPESQIIVDQPLKKIKDGSGQHRVVVDYQGQTAKSTFKVLERLAGATYVEVVIETGRMHQIRAHAAAIGHAVIGDERYNDRTPRKGVKRLFLHAHQLTLPEPDACVISSPLPEDLRQVLDLYRD